ncbi:MAG: cation:proton antiporter, partial [Rhabdochlamydiaceae bacterium]|nr:cation:proton antiporter [Rhabdochlamydiaceae bacterium]
MRVLSDGFFEKDLKQNRKRVQRNRNFIVPLHLLNDFLYETALTVIISCEFIIGPFGFKFIGNAQQIMHFAEFGVIMMLFLIGLELEPETLWRLRKAIVGLGGLQVTLTTMALTMSGILLGFDWHVSLAISMALALSST